MCLASKLCGITASLLLLAVAGGQTQRRNLELQILDGDTSRRIPDAIVTVDGHVIPVDSRQNYTVSADADKIQVRAPGYRAAAFTAAEAARRKEALALAPFAVHALYLTEYGIASKTLRAGAVNILRGRGANALVINIKSDRGCVPYPSASSLACNIGARRITTIPSLTQLVERGHAHGVYMIARIVTFKDDPLATNRPDLAVHTAGGALFKDREHLSWTDPFQPEVRAYNIAIAVEAARAGFDEVQFDYVRFPDAATKLRMSGPTDQAHRVKAIVDFLKEARAALAPYNVFLSVDIFGYVAWNHDDTGIGQHLEEITQTVDYVCPMLYPSGFQYGIPGHKNPLATDNDIYETVKLSLDEAIKRTQADPRKFRPWIQGFRDYAFNRRPFGPAEVAIQIKAANDAGVDGWSLWNARNDYGNSGLAENAVGSERPFTTGR